MENVESSAPRRRRGQQVRSLIMDNLLIVFMVLAIIIGVGLGFGLRGLEGWEYYQKRKIFYLRFPGDLFISMLKMLIIPLVFSSIVSSLASLNANASGRMGIRAVVYYLTTTFAAVVLGIILVLSIQPGNKGNSDINKTGSTKKQEPLEALFDLIRNCFPDNLIETCFRRQYTVAGKFSYTLPNMTAEPINNTYPLIDYETDSPNVEKAFGMNILGIVVFAVFFGCVISRMGRDGKPLLDFFEALHQATMVLTTLVIWFSPIGIIFLVAVKFVEMKDPETVFLQLAYYMVTVLAGLAIHAGIILPLVYFFSTRKNPFKFMFGMSKALLTAWGTASSSATLPITMNCLRDNNNINIKVTKFVAPIGATINMDGTALYEAVAAIFIAQVNNISLDVGQVITISLTATAAAIGAAGIPSAGLVTMAIVLTAVGLPTEDITLILAIDWFLDRFRTAVNVLGDSFGAGIVEHLSRHELAAEESAYAEGSDETISEYAPDKGPTGTDTTAPPDSYNNKGFDSTTNL